jgi:peptide methionine sulfoxide reductase MsrB
MSTDEQKNEEDFKNKLTPEQYKVLREKGTEAPFSGKLIHPDKDGVFKCAHVEIPYSKLMQNLILARAGRASMKQFLTR